MKLRCIDTAMKADASRYLANAVDAIGIFDNLIQPIFPFPASNLSLILSFEEMEGPTMYEIRVNSPTDELISKGSFGVLPDQFGCGRKVINIGNILITERGEYSADIFELSADNKLTFLKTERLFMADYPPQRQFSEAEIEKIISDENLIKIVKTEFKPLEFSNNPEIKPVKLQLSLNKNQEVDEGYIPFPENDTIEINGKTFDLTGMRRHIEWMFGQAIPKAEDNEKNEENHTENKNPNENN